jgi:ADP-ribose pyrophosphatase YjhB (NUDIX family)
MNKYYILLSLLLLKIIFFQSVNSVLLNKNMQKSFCKGCDKCINGYTGAGVLLINQKSKKMILGLDYKNELTDFGGKIDKGEKIYQAAQRELFEETCNVVNKDLNIISNSNNIDIDRVNHRYKCYLLNFDDFNYSLFDENKKKISNVYCNEIKIIDSYDITYIKSIYDKQKNKQSIENKYFISKRLEKILEVYFENINNICFLDNS